ncbi:MAG: Iron-containing alcohol dehydrogenase [Candidatus Bathyarchaeota archaeon BA1]|nr:MAG: Iron-containing alcohol dehydrogenase [Candidatus Bathyarchaeota archaeon BA1]
MLFSKPHVILTGAGCLRKVGAEAKALGGTKALPVTGKVVRKLGYVDQVKGYLEDTGLQVEIFDGVLQRAGKWNSWKMDLNVQRGGMRSCRWLGEGTPTLKVSKRTNLSPLHVAKCSFSLCHNPNRMSLSRTEDIKANHPLLRGHCCMNMI